MARDTKFVRIDYYSVFKKYWSNHSSKPYQEDSYLQLPELFEYIVSLNESDRKNEYSEKFMFLKTFRKSSEDKNIWTGTFISAKTDFAPNIINKVTLKERKSGKTRDDGDKQKTHFCIKIDNDDIFMIMEHNSQGVTLKNLLSYLQKFSKPYSDKIKESKKYTLYVDKILVDNFLEELKKVYRAKEIITYVDKKILGNDYLKFSNKTANVKNKLQLKIISSDGADIKQTAIDLYNKLNSNRGKKEISRLRVIGRDGGKNEVRLDTTAIEKKEFIKAELNITTGEVNSTNMYSDLKALARLL